jgi:hypothetical protein
VVSGVIQRVTLSVLAPDLWDVPDRVRAALAR